jgi:hypothetical protein
MRPINRKLATAVAAVVLFLGVLMQSLPAVSAAGQAVAATPAASSPAAAAPESAAQPDGGLASPGSAGVPSPAETLPPGWAKSPDVVATVQGDGNGLHVLVAGEASAYSWQTVATLGDPGVDTTRWIGQGCVTASGRYMVVVYAPREVTNMASEEGVLGRAAVVDLRTGAVRQLGSGFSVAYFSPGCGTGENVVLTRGGWGGDTPGLPAATTLVMVNAQTGKAVSSMTVPGQATSAVPYGNSIAAAYGRGIAQLGANGRYTTLAAVPGVPFRLVPDTSGGLGYQVVKGSSVQLYRLAGKRATLVGSAPERSVELTESGGRPWLTGPRATQFKGLPAAWRAADVPAGSVMSTTGELAVTDVSSGPPAGGARTSPVAALPEKISAQVLSGKRPQVSFTVPASAAGPAPLSAAGPAGQGPAGPSRAAPGKIAGPEASAGSGTAPGTTTTSPDRTCAIAVDDPAVQAYQPDFQQVEWAADQAVHGDLTDTRPAGLYGSSLPSYTPDGWFPLPGLTGGGTIPAQVLLGVLTQESNLEQASVHVIQGQTSNPLTAFNWFGNWVNGVEGNTVNWSQSDCGYGIGQVTTGMCLTAGQNGDKGCQYDPLLSPSPTRQLAVAVDYQANIAAAARVLASDWNQLAGDRMTMTATISGTNYAGSQYIEDWYMALWAYNSGLEPNAANGNTAGCTPGPNCTDAPGNGAGGNWGLGYANNPANSAYPPDRPVFPGPSPSGYPAPNGNAYSLNWDLSHPQYWPYQEKVLSWAFDAVTLYDYNQGKSVQAFAYAHGNAHYPPLGEFCTSGDNCNPIWLDNTQPTQTEVCQLSNLHCWWHWPGSVACDVSCGAEVLTYALGSPAPANPAIATAFREDCTLGGLPSDAVIVGEDSAAMGCPGQNWTESAPMTWQFGSSTNTTTGVTTYPSKIYFDQIGSGFGGHFWFGYTILNDHGPGGAPGDPPSINPSASRSSLEITGTWPAPSSVAGWTDVLVHLPSYGSWDPQAEYAISPGGGAAIQYRTVNQARQQNAWVSLGTFKLSAGASVSLSNVTFSGLGQDIAWNGLAYVPSSPPAYQYVALGDSYSSGQGLTPYQPDSSYTHSGGLSSNCNRSQTQAYPDLINVPGTSTPIAQKAATAGSGYEFDFLACSGQFTTQITEKAADTPATSYGLVQQPSDQNVPAWNAFSLGYDELPQADTGYINSSTSLVTMTTGGDDARFVPVLTACTLQQINPNPLTPACPGGYTFSGDPEPINQYEPKVLADLQPHLQQVFRTIANDAPHAKIIILGYPNLYAGDTGALGCPPIGPALAGLFNSWGDDLRASTEKAVQWAVGQGINVTFINDDPAFVNHRVCDSDNWINGVTAPTLNPPAVGGGSFHPDPAGQQEFATLVNQCLSHTLPAADLVAGAGSC